MVTWFFKNMTDVSCLYFKLFNYPRIFQSYIYNYIFVDTIKVYPNH